MTTLFKPIKPKKISEEIVEQIKALISQGQLKPGERVPSERDLAAMLGVSRPSVREAIMVLEAMGLVESRQGGGTYVRSLTEHSIADPLTGMMANNTRLLHDLSEVRIGLESWSAYLAAQNATDEEIAEMSGLLEEMRRLAPTGGWPADVDTRFHYAITSASHNTIQVHVLNTIHSLFKATIEVALFEFYRREGYAQILLAQHEAIISAISARDPDLARQKMIDHLSIVKQKMSEFLIKPANA
ncbi:FadR/GntR family transcriptional regulator [Trichloromonas sp.]|uniref:FadR/GntR family transcriptional regulator n=1 Tax=Trichloromonas sp. TaxID=3069249 RepID=UPI003D81A7BC